MWKLLSVLVLLPNLFLIVSSGYGTTAAAASKNVTSTIIIKTHHHHCSTQKCGANEKYVKCPEKICQPQVCEHVGFPQCSSHEEKYFHGREYRLDPEAGIEEPCPGRPACVCIDNYVRNHDGICMSATNCPSCGKDKNSTFGSGVNCGRRCSNYDKGPISCAEVRYINSCDCKEGYVFDDYSGYCVKPEDCSKKDPPKPEGTEGTPGNGEDEDAVTDPCDDCEEDNCDVQETTRPDGGERICTTEGEGTADPNAGENMTTVNSKSSNEPGSSIIASGMKTEASNPEATTGGFRMETTTGGTGPEATIGDSGMESTT